MRRSVLLAAVALGAGLALATVAVAKGPASATVEGPGLRTLAVTGNGEDGGVSRLGRLTQEAGFFRLVFGQTPDPTLRARPKGTLGPRYTIRWSVPGPRGTSRLREILYPYAKPLPLAYMKPDQRFWDGERTRGGWLQVPAAIRTTLGLPARRPR